MEHLHQIPHPRAQRTPWKRKQKENESQRGWGTPGEQSPLTETEVKSIALIRACTRFLHKCYCSQLSIFTGFLLPTLGTLFPLVALSRMDVMAFDLPYYILFCHVWLLSLRSLRFSNGRHKGSGSRAEGRGQESRSSREVKP